MLHLRDDYNVIQDVSALLAAGVLQFGPNATHDDRARFAPGHHTSIGAAEPVFLLRARDVAAAPAVAFWAQRADLHGADPQMVDLIRNRWAVEMADWARQNGGKTPDTPAGKGPVNRPFQSPVRPTQPEGGQP